MTIRQIPDPSLDGTVWGTSPFFPKKPYIRFFHCDPDRPSTPSHVWWDGIAFTVDRDVFYRRPEMKIRPDYQDRIQFGPLELIDDSRSLTLEDLERAEAAVRATAGGTTP
jgi:hypothetical protein